MQQTSSQLVYPRGAPVSTLPMDGEAAQCLVAVESRHMVMESPQMAYG